MGCCSSAEEKSVTEKPQQPQNTYGTQQPHSPPQTYPGGPYGTANPYGTAAPLTNGNSLPPQPYETPLTGQSTIPPSTGLLYVGIDFGTSRSGYAFSMDGDSRVNLQMMYPGETDATPKTLTALLYHVASPQHWEPVAWGMEAYKRFHNLPGKDRKNYRYVKAFKLALLDENPSLPLPPDCPHDAVTLVSHFLSFMVMHIEETLMQTYGIQYRKDSVQWCLTVPARCSDAAKDRMRQAAFNAGMVPSMRSDKVMLVHEPEAAALTVREQGKMQFRFGETFLVVDGGGGTVDITIHNVVERNGKGVLSEATHRDGLLAGSVFIDEQFKNYFFNYMGDKVCQEWYLNNTSDMIKMLHEEWERLKRGFRGEENQREVMAVSLPNSLYRILPDDVKQKLEQEQDGFDDKLIVPYHVLEGFFSRVVDKIIDIIREVIQRARSQPGQILLVGGLGSSPYLFRRMREEFPQVANIITPNFGYAAIIEGAVLHAKEPTLLYQRCALMTYGVETAMPWEHGAPNKVYVQAHDKYMTTHAFSRFVTIDQLVSVDEVVQRRYCPLNPQQRECEFDIYASERPNVRFTTEQGVVKVGSVTVPVNVPASGRLEDAAVTVLFKFGMAEIHITAMEELTRRAVATTITFASDGKDSMQSVMPAVRGVSEMAPPPGNVMGRPQYGGPSGMPAYAH